MSTERPAPGLSGGDYRPTAHTTPTRYRERIHYDRDTVHRILDEALVCHLGYVSDGHPVVLPMTYARCGEVLYLHGSTGGGPMLTAAKSALPVCVTVTLLDGLVLARSALHHSMAYRSVIIHGTARLVTDRTEKLGALAAVIDHAAPGRAADSRPPNDRELAMTAVLALELVEVSAKVRTGGPVDDPEDVSLPHWAGVVPMSLAAGSPEPASDLNPDIELPAYLKPYARPNDR